MVIMPYRHLTASILLCAVLWVIAEDEISLKTPVFSKPLDLRATHATEKSIQLAWTKPNGSTSSNNSSTDSLVGYTIHYQSDNFSRQQEVLTNQDEVQYILHNLYACTDYIIWVTGISSTKEEGEPSDKIKYRTNPIGPSAPKILNISCHQHQSLFIQWQKPALYNCSIESYTVLYRDENSFDFEKIKLDATNDKTETILINNLTDNTMYEIKIRASPKDTILGEESAPRKVLISNGCEKFVKPISPGNETITILAAIVCAFFAVMLAVCAFVIWRNWLHAAYYYLEDPVGQMTCISEPDWESRVDPNTTIPVNMFAAHVAELHADGDIGFSREYESIQSAANQDEYSIEYSQQMENKIKNRYLNILAYDHSRVRLFHVMGQCRGEDYINANYIDGFQRANAYIGTQGPLPITFDAFWRMIWEQGVAIIVMITNLVERGRRKCDMYWPKEGTEVYGLIQVKLMKEDVLAMYTIRTLLITHLKVKKKKHSSNERIVYQYHYTNWPDHGTPDHPLPILNFVNKSSAANPPDAGPIVVHCSAGVGRTGTYIVLDAMLKQIYHKNKVNVFGYLQHIRTQRNFLVQTEEQYIFIHDALLEAIVCSDNGLSPDCINQLIANPNPSNESWGKLETHFKMVTSFEPKDYNLLSARKSSNLPKNRSEEYLPVESFRVHLTPKPGVDGSDYINASWLLGYKKLCEFIVTQHPLESTILDFWQMVWDHNAQTVVLLSSVDEDVSPDLGIFWPRANEGTLDGENFKVKCIEEGTVSRDLTVQSLQDDYELTVRIIESPSPTSDLPALLQLLDIVNQWHLEYQNGPIIVVDKYGGTAAVTFCCLATLSKQLEHEKRADVCMYAKLYHNRRPGVWKSAKDYLLLYQALEVLSISKGIKFSASVTVPGSTLHPNGYTNGVLSATPQTATT